jgi:hypothetical protein
LLEGKEMKNKKGQKTKTDGHGLNGTGIYNE